MTIPLADELWPYLERSPASNRPNVRLSSQMAFEYNSTTFMEPHPMIKRLLYVEIPACSLGH